MAKQEEWITITEAAKRLGLSRSTLYRWAEDGILPIYKIGVLSRIKAEDVDCLVAEARPLYPTPEELDDI